MTCRQYFPPLQSGSMKKYSVFLLVGLVAIFLSGCTGPLSKTSQPENKTSETPLLSPNNMTTPSENSAEKYSGATFETSLGNFTIKFYESVSPKTVANFIKLATSGFYDGTRFHRVIKDFMVQGGDPLSQDTKMASRWGTGGPDYKFADEFNQHKLVRGSLAMANSGPNTNGSQFFIVTAEATPWLDGVHTNFGEVSSGLEVVLKIGNVKTGAGDRPTEDVILKKVILVK